MFKHRRKRSLKLFSPVESKKNVKELDWICLVQTHSRVSFLYKDGQIKLIQNSERKF